MDATTQKWFNSSTVKVERDPTLQGFHTDEELIRLSGAPANSTLKVSVIRDVSIELRVVNPTVVKEMVRYVFQEPGEYAFYIVNAVFVLQDNLLSKGIGPRSISIQLEQAKELGYKRVQTFAVGDWPNFNAAMPLRGYYVWPLMGFDAEILSTLLQHPSFPNGLSATPNLLELFATTQGEKFWLIYGSSIHVKFELAAGSGSWIRHAKYVWQRNIKVTP